MCLALAVAISDSSIGGTSGYSSSWLEQPVPAPWNRSGLSIPDAPVTEAAGINPRCRALARSPESEQDRALRSHGWDLVGDAQTGEDLRVIRGTAGYDGMCRPLGYQAFVFVRGAFAGTLSPQLMDSRTDGALGRVALLTKSRLTAAYSRYAATDALCCPSGTTSVVFEIEGEKPVVRPVSATTRIDKNDRNGGSE
jgi:hypothetical protein